MSTMHALAVGLGGFLGSVARYRLGGVILHHTTSWRLPVSTLAVNLLGCLLVGVLAAWSDPRPDGTPGLGPTARLLLITGFCGGFTTFSAFGLETIYLLRRHAPELAVLNVLLSVLGGVAGVWIGWTVTVALRGR